MGDMIKNNYGIINARYGRATNAYGNVCKVLFTHRNPKNGCVWSDDLIDLDRDPGLWVPSDSVQWI